MISVLISHFALALSKALRVEGFLIPHSTFPAPCRHFALRTSHSALHPPGR